MLRSSPSNFGIFVFVFHVKTPLGVEPKTTPGPEVVKKKITKGPLAIVTKGPSHPFFLVVLFCFILFLGVHVGSSNSAYIGTTISPS